MKLAIPDLISNSYFPALAAAELGFFAAEGLDVSAELIFPVDRAYAALRDGEVDFVARRGACRAVRLSRVARRQTARRAGAGHVLVSRHARRSRRRARRPRRRCRGAASAPRRGSRWGLRGLLTASGLDPARDDIRIGPVPRTGDPGTNFGLAAAEALERGEIDGFWANGMARRNRRHAQDRHDRARCPARRRAAGLLSLHDAGAGRDRSPDRRRAG